MKSDICDTNGHLSNVIIILTVHWEANERACKRDKIKREKRSSNFSDISGSKLWCSSCFNSCYSHCWHLWLCSFRGCSCKGWMVKGSRECWARKVRFENESERFSCWWHQWLLLRAVLAKQREMEGNSVTATVTAMKQGNAQGGKLRVPSWHHLLQMWGSQGFVGSS